MDRSTVVKAPRGPGRPRKVKRGGRKPNAVSGASSTQATTSNVSTEHTTQETPTAIQLVDHGPGTIQSDVPMAARTISKRPSPDDHAPPAKRNRTNRSPIFPASMPHSTGTETPGTPPVRETKTTILPARRSTRNATVQSTQLSEGTLRPLGPPNLEAALNIALRNLESETWRYLWAYNKKHPAGPLPTPAAVKNACLRVKLAAEAVDKADRELEDAIDEIVLSNSKKKVRNGARTVGKPDESGSHNADNTTLPSASPLESADGSGVDTTERTGFASESRSHVIRKGSFDSVMAPSVG